MSTDKLEAFLHLPGKCPQIVKAEHEVTLRSILSEQGVEIGGASDLFIFLGECEDASAAAEDVRNDTGPLVPTDVDRTLQDLDLEQHRHVHCSRCQAIDVTVNFSNKARNRRFLPTATVGAATRWSRRSFRLDDAAASEFVLRISETMEHPRPSEHLGDLLPDDDACSLSFELIKEMTPQG